ncbi:hypothetical protein BKA62DRAFT_700090, partial [Auriculariales sp. MPI-PUGE-AT-0066]
IGRVWRFLYVVIQYKRQLISSIELRADLLHCTQKLRQHQRVRPQCSRLCALHSQMSKTAPINLKLSGGILTGHATVEAYKYSVALTFALQPPPFTVDTGALAYDDRNKQLIGSQPYTGTVGPASLVINFDDGATITAPLVDHISGAHDIAGTGSWSKE